MKKKWKNNENIQKKNRLGARGISVFNLAHYFCEKIYFLKF